MPRSVLVTGASGFAGGHLLDFLTSLGDWVIGWHRPGTRPLAHANVDWEAVDVLDGARVRQAMERAGPAEVYHLAGAAHVGSAWEDAASTLAINVLGTHHVVEAVREYAPDASLLVPSSALVYAPSDRPLTEEDPVLPASPYGLSKLAQEMIARDGGREGPRVLIARAFNHLGPRQSPSFSAAGFARQIANIEAGRAAPEIRVGNLDARRDLTDVRDTVRAYRAIAQRGTSDRPYNVCSGKAFSIRDVLDRLLARARVPISVTIDRLRYRPNDVPMVLGDRSRLEHELGWRPEIPLDRTLDDLLTFWRAQPD